MECINCGQPLTKGELTLPWEDGDNPNAYVCCPYCGYKNIVYGYGEDDD
jgi:DNA-directed RNA polymerase subunit RPC12/RpoP